MSQFYKVIKADPLGEPYETHGKSIQTFWCQFEGVEKAVSMGKQVPNTPQIGGHVYGDLVYAKSQRGNEFWKFRGAKVPEGVQRPADSPAQAAAQQAVGANASGSVPGWFIPFGNMIEFIFKEMKGVEEPAKSNETVVADAAHEKLEAVGEPLDAETQAKIDEIFGV